METFIVLTVIGRDRPGLVSAVSETVAAGGGNWLDTRMASMAGLFAGILLITVPAEKADTLIASLKTLESQGLRLLLEKSTETGPQTGRTLRLELIGLDRPGIVRDISGALARQQVSIAELETERTSGSFSGEAMFKARALLQLPEQFDLDQLRRSIEALANELMVDVSLENI